MLKSYEARYVNGVLRWIAEVPEEVDAKVIVTFLPGEATASVSAIPMDQRPESVHPPAVDESPPIPPGTDVLWSSANASSVWELATKVCPPPALPIKLAPGQILRILVGVGNSGRKGYVPYVLTGEKAYLQLQRGSLPFAGASRSLAEALFDRNPGCTRLIAENILDDFSECEVVDKTVVRTTYVLDLPSSFAEYRSSLISPNLRRDLEREERRLKEKLAAYRFDVIDREAVTLDVLREAATIIEQRLIDKSAREGKPWVPMFDEEWRVSSLPTYQRGGMVAAIRDGDRAIATGVLASMDDEFYYMAAGQTADETKYSVGKLLLYRVIERCIERGGKRLHLGGGDFGYKSRLGARERPLHVVEVRRDETQASLEDRVRIALQLGESILEIDEQLIKPVEELLGTRVFEAITEVDFNTIEENAVLGTDGQCARYQSTLKEAFTTLLDRVPRSPGQTFVDVGSGKGKMLYYAARYGFGKYIGIEISDRLVEIARQNFRRLNLTFDCQLLNRDVRSLTAGELSGADILYLYNPFSAAILDDFLERLRASMNLRRRTIYLIYCNARYPENVVGHGFTVHEEFIPGQPNWRFDYSAIYRLE